MTAKGEWNAARAAYLDENPRHYRLSLIAAYPNYYESRYWRWWVDRELKYEIRQAREDFIRGWLSARLFHLYVCSFEYQVMKLAREEAGRDAIRRVAWGDLYVEEIRKRFERGLRRLGRGINHESWCVEYVNTEGWRLLADWNSKIKEAEQEWQRREATTEQRRHLREGAETLKLLRRHLRSPGQSPLLESRPERTSPTS